MRLWVLSADLALDSEEVPQERHILGLYAEGVPRVSLERNQHRLRHLPRRDALPALHELLPSLPRRLLRPVDHGLLDARWRLLLRLGGRRRRFGGSGGVGFGRAGLGVTGRGLVVRMGGEVLRLLLLLELVGS